MISLLMHISIQQRAYVADNNLDYMIDGAIQNGGGVRATVEAGDISMDKLYTVFPFGNTISIVTVTGEQLLEALEAFLLSLPGSTWCIPTGIRNCIYD